MAKYLVIVGGNFINKGAESMTYISVDQLKRIYPHHEIVLLDYYPVLSTTEKELYNFRILNFGLPYIFLLVRSAAGILFSLKRLARGMFNLFHNRNTEKKVSLTLIREVLSDTELMVDISGYGLSSHNQPFIASLSCLMNIKMAYLYKIPYIILPQTLGPFRFSSFHKIIINSLIEKYLSYPKYIFVRESEGLKDVNEIRQTNVYKEYDIALQSKEYNLDNIFKRDQMPTFRTIKVNDYICIIPNVRLLELISETKVLRFYQNVISYLINKGEKIVILRHSLNDFEICSKIHRLSRHENILLLNSCYYPFELENILLQTKYVISSRYHGLVHALKNNIPCVAIGWANKYNDLMESMSLGKYCFSHKDIGDHELIIRRLNELEKDYHRIKKILSHKIADIQESNIFTKYDI